MVRFGAKCEINDYSNWPFANYWELEFLYVAVNRHEYGEDANASGWVAGIFKRFGGAISRTNGGVNVCYFANGRHVLITQ